MGKKLEVQNVYSLTPMQEGMLFHSIYNKESRAYFERTIFTMKGELDIKAFQESFNELINRYDILRTIFAYENLSKPRQIVFKKRQARVCYEDISNLNEEDKIKYIENFIEDDKKRGFDTTKDILMRVSILKIKEDEYKTIWSHHHIIIDGWCVGIILSDFFKIYEGTKNNHDIKLNKVYPFINYIEWLKKQDGKEARDYWSKYLNEFENKTEMPKYKLGLSEYKSKELRFELDYILTEQIEKMAKDNQVTINVILQAIWGILLQRYTNADDVVFGAVVSGRNPNVEGIENMVGLFLNTIPVRVKSNKKMTVKELLNILNDNSIKSSRYDYYSLAEIQSVSKIKQNLIDNIIVFENYPINKEIEKVSSQEAIGFNISSVEIEEETNYDLNIIIHASNNITLKFLFNENAYEEKFINNIGQHFVNIAKSITRNDEVLVNDIDLLTEGEKNKILYEFNNTYADYPRDKTIHQLFEEQAERTPDNIAAVFEDKKLTYKELNERSNRLARTLREKGVKPEDIVAIMVERSVEMIVGIMGILKAGGAYLPIDPEYPEDRIRYVIEDSKANIILTQDKFMKKLLLDGEKINLEDESVYSDESDNLEIINTSKNLAYVIYTSGSTGVPKGVMIEHHSVINRINWMQKSYPISEADVILQKTTYTFDVSVWELFWWSFVGASVCLLPYKGERDPEAILNCMKKNNITTVHFVPSMFSGFMQYVDAKGEKDKLLGLRQVFCSGEALSNKHVEMFGNLAKDKRLINLYGPTEATVDVSFYECLKEESFNSIPIGKPIDNISLHIIDSNSKLQPIGVAGELYISGAGLARGYLNNLELTKERFIENPFLTGEKMYKTGDLARWLPDGNIEFLGRIDHQVKIRGFRMELGEIEYQLLNHEEIKEAVVIDRKDENGNKFLCAYVVSDKELTVGDLRECLSKRLPEYMIPSYFVQLEEMPLTANGKIDRKVLIALEGNVATGIEYEAPRNEVEEKLVDIWIEVLGGEKIGINDNFFELGGHSLKATTVVSKIHKELNIEIPLREIFNLPTIKGISEYMQSLNESIYASIDKVEDQEYYEASSAQKRMYMLQQFDLEGTGYNMPGIIEVKGQFDIQKVEKAFNELIERHETLRTSFETIEDKLVQRVSKAVTLKVEYHEISCLENSDKAKENIIKGFVRAFNLENAPLLRVGLIKVEENNHILMFDIHHIISDAVSTGLLIKEFAKLYEGQDLGKLRIQYKDFAAWQNKLLKSESMEKQEQYWINRFLNEIPVLNMPTDYQRPSIKNFEGDNIIFTINKELTARLKKISRETGNTLYMIMLSAINILLSKYSGQEDIVVGSPIAGRLHTDLEGIIGMFVNTLAMRNMPSGEKTYEEFLKEVKEGALKAYENQDYQFEALVDKLDLTRDTSRNPLFDVMFVLQNTERQDILLEGITFNPYRGASNISKFDLTITAVEVGEEIALNIEYSTRLFKKETMKRTAEHIKNILYEITKNTKVRLKDIEMLREDEKKKLLYEFNDTYAEYPREKTLNELFEEQVQKTPNNAAVVFKENKLTYKELNEKANKLAWTLRDKGVGPDTIVGIMVERSLEMIIGIMGILKAGGGYLPIDPEYPEERKRYILKDSNAALLITQSNLLTEAELDIEILDINDNEINKNSHKNLGCTNSSENIAYVIYTSGSTGKPKGVLIEHRNVVSLKAALTKMLYGKLNGYLNIALVAPYVFDASVQQIFPTILMGHSLFIADEDARKDGTKLAKFYKENSIDISDGTPIHINMLSNVEASCCEEISVMYFIIGGDILPCKTVKEFANKFKKRPPNIINVYGPTECCVDSIYYPIDYEKLDAFDNIPIGKPMANEKIYILDKNKKLVSKGICGEIYISGDGVARGYLNNPELSADKFEENPFDKRERMYRTGDLAKWLNDGNIEFLGRIDHQVKIRGFRIEIGEVESNIAAYEGIREAVVIDREDENGNKYLCAYVVSENEIIVGDIRKYLTAKLPNYMIPSYFVQLEKMPLTSNGKIDRKALPKPEGKINTGVKYEAPRNDVEEKLCLVWQEVLGGEMMGINDNFFELGGDSIKAIQIVARLKRYGYTIEMRDLFKTPYISELESYVKKLCITSSQDMVEGNVELTPIQAWFFEKNFADKHHWNQTVMIHKRDGFAEEIVKAVFDKITLHHDALRMVYEATEDKVVQFNRGNNTKTYDFEVFDFRNKKNYQEEITSVCNKIQGSINLSSGPLVKVGLFKTDDGDHMLIAIHHLVIDGVSWRIIFEDFAQGYKQYLNGEEIIFQDKTTSYKEWAQKLKEYSLGRKAIKELGYWSKVESEEIMSLPKEYVVTNNIVQNFKTLSINLSTEDTDKLLRNVNAAYNTEINDILLTALGLTIKEWTKLDRILINLEGHGREQILDGIDISRTIGWFTIQYPVILDMRKSEDISYGIKSVKENLRHIPNKGIGYGILRYLSDKDVLNDMKFILKPEIVFNYLGQFDQDIPVSTFEISRISSGKAISNNNESLCSLSFVGIIADSKLNISLSYNSTEYSEQTIKNVLEIYKHNLCKVIEHCVLKEKSELTPTDLGDEELTLDELEFLSGFGGEQ